MADFHQEGIITTLHGLYAAYDGKDYLEALESKLEEHSRHVRIALLLPSLFSEIENRTVLDRIIGEIKKVHYIHSIVVALGGAPEEAGGRSWLQEEHREGAAAVNVELRDRNGLARASRK